MRIEDYGLIGDMGTAALVGRNGSVDWLCLPRFDSPTCFSALLGDERHGRWLLAPTGEVVASSRRYRPGTLVLETDLETAEGTVRVIAGEYAGARGPANTFTPIHIWDLHLSSNKRTELTVPDGYTTALVVLKGALRVNGSEAIESAEVGLFDRAGKRISIECVKDTTALLLCGEPIDESIVGQGPFVMNTSQEIRQAMADYLSGKNGSLVLKSNVNNMDRA